MEPKGSLVEHIYAEIKREICSGSVRPGERIDVAGLCKRFGSSKSPVRSALYWLVGENLLELHAHDGFYRPRLTKDSAEDLYSWYEDQVLIALAKAEAKSTGDTPPPPLPQDPEDLVEATEVLFEAIARLSGTWNMFMSFKTAMIDCAPLGVSNPPISLTGVLNSQA